MQTIIRALRDAQAVGCLTGAGISTLCGIPDFRGPQGLYKNPDAERIFDVDWFERDPTLYYRGAAELVYGLSRYEPGPVHLALKRLEDVGKLQGIATQNIDMLHQKAGSTHVHEVHGSPLTHRCFRCGTVRSFDEIMAMVRAHGGLSSLGQPYVPQCPCGGAFKPDITFFGESLPEAAFDAAQDLASRCDLFLVLGTSLTVYPAANLPRLTLSAGGKIALVNAQPTALDRYAVGRAEDLDAFAQAVLSAF